MVGPQLTETTADRSFLIFPNDITTTTLQNYSSYLKITIFHIWIAQLLCGNF